MVYLSQLTSFDIAVLAISGLLISALFMLRVVMKTFYGPANPQFADLPDVRPFLITPRAMLAGTILLFGLFPWMMLNLIQVSTSTFPGVVGF